MQIVVNLGPNVEELLRRDARGRNLELGQVLNDAIHAGLAPHSSGKRRRFVQKTHWFGSPPIELTHVFMLADELEDEETIRKMRLAEKIAEGQ